MILYTEQALSEETGFAVGTLQNWRCMNPPKGPAFIKIGSAVRYRPVDVEAWVLSIAEPSNVTQLPQREKRGA
jgi:predicted DNA-binding transcriptional regulator AlpA